MKNFPPFRVYESVYGVTRLLARYRKVSSLGIYIFFLLLASLRNEIKGGPHPKPLISRLLFFFLIPA